MTVAPDRTQTPAGSKPPATDGHESLIPLLSLISGLGQSADRDVLAEADEKRYRDFLEAIGVAVYTTDANGRITFFNRAAVDFWGRTPELGEEWCGSWRLFWPDGRPMRHDECPMAIALRENRTPRGYEAVAERPDGTRVSFVPYPTPLCDADGSLVGAVNVLVDVTERTRAEEALRATAGQLRLSNEVKDEFLGLVSHELRTPVTTIFGNAQLLRERRRRLAEGDRDSMIEDIADDSERLLGVIENLLLLTRLESGSQLDPEPQVLGHILRKSIDSFRQRHVRRGVTLTSQPPRHLVVDVDRTYLELLINNLLSNADKYSPPEAEIELAIQAAGDEVCVVVLDRGIGVSAEDADEMFAPFYRTEAGKRHANGLGIGLAVCKRIVEAHRGRIWAGPRNGGGSEIGFALPLARDPVEALGPAIP